MAEYIEREAVVHHFMNTRRYLTKDLVMDAAYEVSKFPAADVAPVVHGRWVDWGGEPLWRECTACNYRIQYSYSKDCNYCPNCGAHMKDGDG